MPKLIARRSVQLTAAAALFCSFFSSILSADSPAIKTFSLGSGASGATDIVARDVNGDGVLDLIVSNGGSNNISVLLGQGRGRFAPALLTPTGADPKSLAIGDFNRDGKLDVVTANFADGSISVLFGKGDGTFQVHQDFSVGIQTQSVAVGDVNNDGIPDIVVSSVQSENTDVFLSNGDGSFQAPITFVFYNGYAAWTKIALADMNGDGNLDFVGVFGYGQGFQVWIGHGDGTFTDPGLIGFPCTAPYPFGLGIGDFNGDGIPDVLTGLELNNGLDACLLKPNGRGSQVNSDAPMATTLLALGDLNEDGKLDAVTANVVGHVLEVELGNGDGTFQSSTPIQLGVTPAAAVVEKFVGKQPSIAFVSGGEAGLIVF